MAVLIQPLYVVFFVERNESSSTSEDQTFKPVIFVSVDIVVPYQLDPQVLIKPRNLCRHKTLNLQDQDTEVHTSLRTCNPRGISSHAPVKFERHFGVYLIPL